jgi:hypothetical protein
VAAKVPRLLFHDLRRPAVYKMGKSGAVTQAVAVKITGHKTDSVYRRCRIADEADIEHALDRTSGVDQASPRQKRCRDRKLAEAGGVEVILHNYTR